MPIQPTYPGLYIEELPASGRTIAGAPTSIAVFVGYVHPFQGLCQKDNLWNKPIPIFNFADYERYFGGIYNNELLGKCQVAYAVNQFFLNGGFYAYVVGLEPKLYETGNPNNVFTIAPATNATPLSGMTFTAKELTDEKERVRITIRNFRTRTTTNDLADVLVTYGRRDEVYRDVLAPEIGQRLARSELVSVAPSGGTFLSAYALNAGQNLLELDLFEMPEPAGWTGAPTPYSAADFLEAFTDDGDLDKLDIFNLLVVPGVSDVQVWSRALSFCEAKRAFFILDPPEDAAADASLSMTTMESLVQNNLIPVSKNGAIYFPYLRTLDPISGDEIALPPSGFVAGVFARTDTARGVWKAPAGLETTIVNTTGVVPSGRMTDMRQGRLNELGVNVLRQFPGVGTVVWGARSLVTTNQSLRDQWKYVPVRRMALFIEQTLLRNLGWVVFEPNDEPLWSAIRLSIDGFMLSLFRQQAFQGSKPSEAFLVKCDSSTTSQEDRNNGIVNIVVGFRPLKPAEFVIIKIAQLAGQVQT
jgi:phage tail sheath protein FI